MTNNSLIFKKRMFFPFSLLKVGNNFLVFIYNEDAAIIYLPHKNSNNYKTIQNERYKQKLFNSIINNC